MKHLICAIVLLVWSTGCSVAGIRKNFKWAVPTVKMWDCKLLGTDKTVADEFHEVSECRKAEWQ